jgi:hypothetical protein
LGNDRPHMGKRKGSMSFEKELSAVLECDVCAQIMHKPVTTPCQHVGTSIALRFPLRQANFECMHAL